MEGVIEDDSELLSFDELYEDSTRLLAEDFTNRLITLFWRNRAELKSRTKKSRLTREPVFLRTGIWVNPPMDVFGFDFFDDSHQDHFYSGTLEHILDQRLYVGIDLQYKHLAQYADILAKMRIAYDFARENRFNLVLPRLYCKLRQDGKDVGILTEDISADGLFALWDGVSDEEYEKQGLCLFDGLFSAEDMDRHFFMIRFGDKTLFPLVDLDHVRIGKKYIGRHSELVQAYRDKYVHEI